MTKKPDGEESTDVVEMDAMDVVEWEREQHTPLAAEPNLAALVKQSAQKDEASAKKPPATPRPTRNAMPVPLGSSPAGELPRASAPAKQLADAAADSAPSSRVPNATIPTPQPLMQQLLKAPTKNTTQRTPRLAGATVPTPPSVQQTLVSTSEKAPAAPAPPPEVPAGGWEELDDAWGEEGAAKPATKSDAQAYSAPATPRVTTSNTVRRTTSTSQPAVRKTGAMGSATPPKAGTVTEPLPTVAKPANGTAANGAPANGAQPAANGARATGAQPAAEAAKATKLSPQASMQALKAAQQAKAATPPTGTPALQPAQPAQPATAKPATASQAPVAKPATASHAAAAKPATASQPATAKPATAARAPVAAPAPVAKPATAAQPPAKRATEPAKPAAQPPTAKLARPATEDKPTLIVEPIAAIVPVEASQRPSEPALLPPPPIAPAMPSAPRALPLAARDDDWDGLAPSKPSKPNSKPISRPDYDDDDDAFAPDREPSVIIDLNAKAAAPKDLDWGLANAALAADAIGTSGGTQMPIQTSELNTTASGVFVMPTAASPTGRSPGAPKSNPAIVLPPPEDDDLAVPSWTPPKKAATVVGAPAYPSAPPKAATGAATAYAPKPTLAEWNREPQAAPAAAKPILNPSASGRTNAPAPPAGDWSIDLGTASEAAAFPADAAPPLEDPPRLAPPYAASPSPSPSPSPSVSPYAASPSPSPYAASPSAPTVYPAASPSSGPIAPPKPPGVAFAFAPAAQQSVQAPRAPEPDRDPDPAIPQPLAHGEQTERRIVPRSLLATVLPTPKAKRIALIAGGGAMGLALLLALVLSSGGKGAPAPEPAAPVVAVAVPAPAPAPPKVEPPKPAEVAAADPAPAPPAEVEPPKEAPKPVVRRIARPAKPLVLDYDKSKADAPAPTPTPDQALARARAAYAAGNQHLFAGEADDAVASYKQALAAYPGYVAGYRGLGLAYAQAGDRAAALKAFQKYVALVPNAKDVSLIEKRIARLAGQ